MAAIPERLDPEVAGTDWELAWQLENLQWASYVASTYCTPLGLDSA